MAIQTRRATSEARGKGTPQQAVRAKPASSQQTTQGVTGERDENYDLVSVLYHALQGAQTCNQYMQDAKRASDRELASFFERTCEEYARLAAKARHLLASRLDESDGTEEEDGEDEEDEEDEDDGEHEEDED